MHTILLLAGGTSREREVSLRSGQAVAEALQSQGYHVLVRDPSVKLHQVSQPDAVFPVLHGQGGEDGTIQEQLENMGVPFVGSDAAASRCCFDKWKYRQLLGAHKLPIAEGALVTATSLWRSALARSPFVLKPFDGGSSIDTHIVRNPQSVDRQAIEDSFTRNPKMLIEGLIEGTEITVGVLGDQALQVIEIIPPSDKEFDYENKYNGQTQELCPPQNVSNAAQTQAQELALQIHQLCGCRDFSRTDMIVTPDGECIVLETNTIPGMTAQSLFPKAAAAAGLAMPELAERLVAMALARKS
jgi:D-alanine-D-alanine ligase